MINAVVSHKYFSSELGSGDGSSKVTAIANKVQVEKGAGDEASPKKQEQKPKVQM